MTYDQVAVMATAFLVLSMLAVKYAAYPAYNYARSVTLVSKKDYAALQRQVRDLERMVAILRTDVFKLESDGQMRFDLPVEQQRVIRLPFVYKDKKGKPQTKYQVWFTDDYQQYKAGKILVRRNRRIGWIKEDDKLPNDEILRMPCRWEYPNYNYQS